jgi:hypothetical protein
VIEALRVRLALTILVEPVTRSTNDALVQGSSQGGIQAGGAAGRENLLKNSIMYCQQCG